MSPLLLWVAGIIKVLPPFLKGAVDTFHSESQQAGQRGPRAPLFNALKAAYMQDFWDRGISIIDIHSSLNSDKFILNGHNTMVWALPYTILPGQSNIDNGLFMDLMKFAVDRLPALGRAYNDFVSARLAVIRARPRVMLQLDTGPPPAHQPEASAALASMTGDALAPPPPSSGGDHPGPPLAPVPTVADGVPAAVVNVPGAAGDPPGPPLTSAPAVEDDVLQAAAVASALGDAATPAEAPPSSGGGPPTPPLPAAPAPTAADDDLQAAAVATESEEATVPSVAPAGSASTAAPATRSTRTVSRART
jgi:hypothetical protein